MVKNKKCEHAFTNVCKKGNCLIFGTNYCKEGMPQPGACTIRPCYRICKVWGTDFCVDGKIKDLSKGLDLDSLMKNLKPDDFLKQIDPKTMINKFLKK